ncbi:MAG: hypothetical protein Q9227_006881 [Pyrenula ochraceoflavens]
MSTSATLQRHDTRQSNAHATKPPRIEVSDTVVLKEDRTLIGEVERTSNNYDWESLEEFLIISHVPVPDDVIEEFRGTGIPPRGYVLVRWANELYGMSVVPERDLILLNRRFAIGDSVKRESSDAMVGVVASVDERFTLEPIWKPGRDNPVDLVDKTYTRITASYTERSDHEKPSTVESEKSLNPPRGFAHRTPEKLLHDVPGQEICRASDFESEDHVVSKGWFGVLQESELDVVLLLEDGSVVVVHDPYSLEIPIPDFQKPLVHAPLPASLKSKRPTVPPVLKNMLLSVAPEVLQRGQYVITNDQNLRNGRWIRGSWDESSNLASHGRILDVRTKSAEVSWLCPNVFNDSSTEPPITPLYPYDNNGTFTSTSTLQRNKAAIILYDHDAQPQDPPSPIVNKAASFDFEVGQHVRLRDSTKFLDPIPEKDSYGFDLNQYTIVCGHQDVTILWQDGSRSLEHSTNLHPHALPESELTPGEFVLHKEDLLQVAQGRHDSEATSYNEIQYLQGTYNLIPRKIGVIQKVNSRERLAEVRWFKDPKVKLLEGGNVLCSGSVLGPISDTIEMVSLYEIMTQPGLDRRRADIVILPPKHPTHRSCASIRNEDHLGQIIGPTLLSWLGSAKPEELCQDLRLIAKDLLKTWRPPRHARRSTSLDWVGEIVDLGLDGLITVRLGATRTCEEIRVPLERILMVIDSDAEEIDAHDYYSDYSLDDDESAYESDITLEETVEYEGGERIGNDSDEDVWMTEEEDKDNAPSNGDTWDTDDEGDVVMKDTNSFSKPDDLSPRKDKPPSSTVVPNDKTTPPRTNDNRETHSQSSEANRGSLQALKHSESDPNSKRNYSSKTSLNSKPAATSKPVANSRPGLNLRASLPLVLADPPRFAIQDTQPPADHHYIYEKPSTNPKFLRRIQKEHKILSDSLPPGTYVRAFESRLDLLRVMIIGAKDTPYELAPFLIDFRLGADFPAEPPKAFFHSWTHGLGRINPNLYEEGKVCLSLLGTWPGKSEGESWTEKSNEAGFESLEASGEYAIESAHYTEKCYVMARGFIKHALRNLVLGFEDVLTWNYLPLSAGESAVAPYVERPGMLRVAVARAKRLMGRVDSSNTSGGGGMAMSSATSATEGVEEEEEPISSQAETREGQVDGEGNPGGKEAFMQPLSKGAVVMLRKCVAELEGILEGVTD